MAWGLGFGTAGSKILGMGLAGFGRDVTEGINLMIGSGCGDRLRCLAVRENIARSSVFYSKW